MALVSEVLQEKEGSPAKEIPSKTNQSSKITGEQTRLVNKLMNRSLCAKMPQFHWFQRL